jgi:glycosyltransferase involved in cell wall biosynthesis
MKVLQVVEPGIDGVFRHVEGLTRFLAERGVQVSLAYSDVRGSEGLRRLVAEVTSSGGKTLNLAVGNKPSLNDVFAALKLHRMIVELEPDVLHGHSSKAGGLLRLPFVSRSLPVFYTPHAYYGMAQRSGAGPWMFDRIESVLARRCTTINISRDEAAFARDRLKVPVARQRVIHNPVRTDRFRPASADEKRVARAGLGIPENALAIGTVGRMTFQKDPETLYRAIAPLLRRRPELFLLHLGEGELHDDLRSLCAALMIDRQVRFCGYSEDPVGFYHSLDAMAMTSRYEAGWPIVTLEALACDLPIVSSRAPGTADIDKAGLSHCWSADAGDIAGFEAAITRLLEDLPHQRPSNHRELTLRRFSPEACYGAVLSEYRAASSKEPHTPAAHVPRGVEAREPLAQDRTASDTNRGRNLELD